MCVWKYVFLVAIIHWILILLSINKEFCKCEYTTIPTDLKTYFSVKITNIFVDEPDGKKLLASKGSFNYLPKRNPENKHRHHKTNLEVRKRNIRSYVLPIGKGVDLGAKFYIEREFLNASTNFGLRSNLRYLKFDDLSVQKLLMLSDTAGSGKSTTFRHIAQKFKENFKHFWVSYIDLKQYVHVLPEISQITQNLTQISDFLSQRFLNLTNNFTSKIFKNSFKTNQAIFLWDGVDEISPVYFNETIKIIGLISNLTKNRQWISTRPICQQEIEKILNTPSYKLKPLDENDRKNFISNFTKSINTSETEHQKHDILKFISSLENFGIYDNKRINNPRFLFELCNFSINNPLELFQFYTFFINKLKDIAKKKGEVVRISTKRIIEKEMFRQIHQYFAFQAVFSLVTSRHFNSCNSSANSLGISKMTLNFISEDILRFGILKHNKFGKFEFQHETFADYFAAQYFFQNVWEDQKEVPRNKEAETRLEFLLHAIRNINGNFKLTLDFLSGFINQKFKIDHKISEIFTRIIKNRYKNYLQTLGDNLHGIKFATNFFKKDFKTIETLWKIDHNSTFFLEYFMEISYSDCSFRYCFTHRSKYKTLRKLTKIVQEIFDENYSKKIFEGNFQTVNKLFIIWMNINREEFVNEFAAVTNFNSSFNDLHEIDNFSGFLNYLESKKFSKCEIGEFLRSNLKNVLTNVSCPDVLKAYWKFFCKNFKIEEINQILMEKNIVQNNKTLQWVDEKGHSFEMPTI